MVTVKWNQPQELSDNVWDFCKDHGVFPDKSERIQVKSGNHGAKRAVHLIDSGVLLTPAVPVAGILVSPMTLHDTICSLLKVIRQKGIPMVFEVLDATSFDVVFVVGDDLSEVNLEPLRMQAQKIDVQQVDPITPEQLAVLLNPWPDV